MRHKHSITEDPVKLAGVTAIAAAVGAAVAMLITPRDGSEVRSGLKRRARNVAHDLHDHLDHVEDKVSDASQDAKDKLQSTAEKAVSKTKSAASEAKSDAKTVQRQADKAAKEASDSSK